VPIYIDYFMDVELDQEYSNAIKSFKKVSETLMEDDRIEKILPMMLDMLKDDSEESKRICGLRILDSLATDFGQEVCSNYLIYEIVSLQDDPLYKVRKETCKNLVSISSVVEEDIF
jgi:serine/threonine-protein phosphatase 4 regulatory subunit 1